VIWGGCADDVSTIVCFGIWNIEVAGEVFSKIDLNDVLIGHSYSFAGGRTDQEEGVGDAGFNLLVFIGVDWEDDEDNKQIFFHL
jgi:hypothetical protein